MPRINVSERVIEMIGSLRLAKRETENDVLERILERTVGDRAEHLRAYERAERDDHSTN